MGWIDINEVVRELLALKAANEDLTKRITKLELEVEGIASDQRDRSGIRYLHG